MKKTILFFMMLFLGAFGIAQETAKNSIQLDWGLGTLHRQDLSFSSLIHNPITPINTQITYQRSGKWNHEVSSRFGLFKEWTAKSYPFYQDAEKQEEVLTNPHQFVFLDINYSLIKTLISNDKWEFSLGARERNRLQITDFSTGEGTHFSYYFCFGIDAKTSMKYSINEKSKISANLYLPIFSHISRPPYAAQDGEYFYDSRSNNAIPTVIEYIERGTFESWKNSQIFDFDLAYKYSLNDRWSIGAKYLLSMNFNQKPNTLNSIENYYYITTEFKF